MHFKSPKHLAKHMLQEYTHHTTTSTLQNLLQDYHHSPDAYMITILYLFREIYRHRDVYFPEQYFKQEIKKHWRNFLLFNI